MAVVTETSTGELVSTERWDAEYFQPIYLDFATRLHAGDQPTLGSLAKLTCSAFYPSATALYVSEGADGTPFIRCVDVNEYPVIHQDQPFERLPESFIKQHRSIRVATPGDIIVSKVGSPCFASYLPEDVGTVALTRTVLALRHISPRIDPYYLVAFLRSKYGFYQLYREREQQIQFQLTLDRVRRIRVLVPDKQIQNEIGQMIRKYSEARRRHQSSYTEAGSVLERELGIEAPDLSKEVGFDTTLSEILAARRWDSEYYKPKYVRVLAATVGAKRVKVERLTTVGRLVSSLTNGHTPLRHDLSQGDVVFLTAEHVSDFRLDFKSDKRITWNQHTGELARTALRNFDVLITIKGRVGNCAVVQECPKLANINQDVALLRLRAGIQPYFVAAWFNSQVGKQLVDQRSTGGINPFVGLGNLRKMPFPVIAREEQIRIGELVGECVSKAHDADIEATKYLKAATARVDELVEST